MTPSRFNIDVPRELIAQHPPARREQSRMMVVARATGDIRHCQFTNFVEYPAAGDVVVLNNTRVMPCRLKGNRATGGAVDALLITLLPDNCALAMLTKSARIKPGECLIFEAGLLTAVAQTRQNGKWLLRFACTAPLRQILQQLGRAPLPPYIERAVDDPHRRDDLRRYQSIFATREGAVAAPTASLHFGSATLKALQIGGVNICYVTLHVGEGTFLPITAVDPRDHKMHEEYFELSAGAAGIIQHAKAGGHKIFAVGTTVVRCLETAARRQADLGPSQGQTDLFIYPPFEFRVVDAMLTNFHLPDSTLLYLVAAFAGAQLIENAYHQAVAARYRFYSYGDCMLLV